MSLDPKALELALWLAPGVMGDRKLFEMQSKPWQEHWLAQAERAIATVDLISREEAVRACDPWANQPVKGASAFVAAQAHAAQQIQDRIRQLGRAR